MQTKPGMTTACLRVTSTRLAFSVSRNLKNISKATASGASHPTLSSTRHIHSFSEEAIGRYRSGGYHPVRIGDDLSNGRYKIINKLGYGQYATVWLAFDERKSQHVAVKILTSDSYGGSRDTFELEVLEAINHGPTESRGRSHVLESMDHFRHRGPHGEHVCIVFPAMGPGMSALRKEFHKLQIPIPMLKLISRHLLLALTYLHDSCRIIHTDIKPSNILITTSELKDMFQHAPSDVLTHSSQRMDEPHAFYMKSEKIAAADEHIPSAPGLAACLTDFGTASFFDKHLAEWIQPAMLRAPEVLLGAKWNWSVDIWNLGLVIWELAEGKVLFDGCAAAEAPYSTSAHLAQIEVVLGPMPKNLLDRSAYAKKFYSSSGELKCKPDLKTGTLDTFTERQDLSGQDRSQFLNFIGAMLSLAPEKRPTAAELLAMPWVRNKHS